MSTIALEKPSKKAQVLLIYNPFDAFGPGGMDRRVIVPGVTIRQWVDANISPGWVSWELPTLCQLNGTKMGRATWETTVLQPGDVLTFSVLPGWELVVMAIIAIVVAIVAVMMIEDPLLPTEGTQADSVYTWKGQDNRLRMGEPVESHYGRVRCWPSYAAPPYSVYDGNASITHALFCLGQGVMDIEDNMFYLEDTEVTNFDNLEIEVIPPGGVITLFNFNVVTSVEVSNIELYGTNQVEYDGFSGPYTVNDTGTQVKRLEVDITFPQGLFTLSEGLRGNASVGHEFQYREIDNAGDPVGAGTWNTLSSATITRKSNTPQRLTLGLDVPAGRYEVQGRRSSTKPTGTSNVSTMYWESLKGYSSNDHDYGDVTLVAMKAQATNNLNANTRSRLNCFLTRKLPIWNNLTSTWSAPTATRNPIWAFCDVFRSAYGARLPDEYLDMDTMTNLAAIAEEREDWFDFTFDQRMTIWEAGKTCLRVMRSVPIPQGSLVTAVRDQPRTLPSAIFNQGNIAKNSMVKKLAMFEFQAKDAIMIEYTDSATWKPEEVLCTWPGYSGEFVSKLKLPGVTSRNQAYREGMYILGSRLFKRKTLSFETGMEGYIPTHLDLVAVAHDVVRVGQGGFIMQYDDVDNVVTLSEKVNWVAGLDHYIVLRGPDGAIQGEPIQILPWDLANRVQLVSPPPAEFDFSDNQTPPFYVLGPLEFWAFKGNVTSVKPKGNDRIALDLSVYDPRVFTYDNATAPALVSNVVIRDPDAPVVENVVITSRPDNPNLATISWKPSAGAQAYRIQVSYDDGVSWDQLAEVSRNTTSYEFTVVPGDMKVRVSARSQLGRTGAWTSSTVATVGISGTPPAAPVLDSSQAGFTGLEFTTTWQPAVGAIGYSVSIYDQAGPTLLRTEDVGAVLEYTYDADMRDADGNPTRDLEIRISSYAAGNTSTTPAIRQATNAKPAMLTGTSATSLGGLDYRFAWSAVSGAPADFTFYRVYASTTMGFTPEAGNLIYEGTALLTDETLTAGTWYWRVAAFDRWASSHTDANFTNEATFTI